MLNPISSVCGPLAIPLLCLLSMVGGPTPVWAASVSERHLAHLGSNEVIAAILISNSVLLLGFFMRLRQIRKNLSKTEENLAESETHMRLLGDNLPHLTFFQLERAPDESFSFRYLSKGFERTLGLERDSIKQNAKLIFDHLYEADITTLKAAYRSAECTLEPVRLDFRMLDISGNLKWLRVNAAPHRRRGTLIWNGVMQDISETKRIEEELAEEKQNFQNLFETMDDFLLVCDMNGSLLHSNPTVERRLGYAAEELSTMRVFDLYSEESRPEACQVMARMQSEKTGTCSFPFQHKNKNMIPVEMHLFQGFWKNKKAIFGVARDVTSRQESETALRDSQHMLELIMDTIPMSIFWKDKNSEYLGSNKAFIKECNLSSIADVIGKKPTDLFDAKTAAFLISHDQQVLNTNEPLFNVLHSHTRLDGSAGWREMSKIPLRDEDHHAVGVLGVWRDVTQQNQAEDRLKRTLEDMERFNQLMRGRERRTLELKGEVNALLKKNGNPAKYRTTTDRSA